MVTLQALLDTIDRFEKKRLFNARVIYLHKYDFLFRPERIGYIIYMRSATIESGKIQFVGNNGVYITDILTNDQFLIKNIIE